MAELPPIDYTARDYAATRQSLLERIPALLPEWTRRDSSDFGIVMIELFSAAADILAFYADRIINEPFLSTAVMRSSVLDIATMLGYTPASPAAATGSVTFTITASAPGAVTIPAGTRLAVPGTVGTSSIVFETDSELIITPPTLTGSVTVTQGQTVLSELGLTSSGAAGQQFSLFQPNVIGGSIVIEVDAGLGLEEWSYVASLSTSAPGEKVFTTSTDVNGVTWVRFGDGVNGAVPPAGSLAFATYRVGNGAAGNVSAGAISQLVDTVQYVTAVTNSTALVGGEDAESLESIRKNAPLALRSLDRAITADDYGTLALQVPGVLHATAVGNTPLGVAVYICPTGAANSIRNESYAMGWAATAGTFDLTITTSKGTATLTNVANDISPSALQSTLEGTAAFDPGDVTVEDYSSEVAGATSAYLITFLGDFAAMPSPVATTFTLDSSGLTLEIGSIVIASRVTAGGAMAISDELRSAVNDFLADRVMLGSTYTLAEGVFTPVQIEATVNVLDSYPQAEAQASVENALAELFSVNNLDFGQRVTLSDVYHKLLDVTGVDYVSITKYHPEADPSTLENVVTPNDQCILRVGTTVLTMSGGV
jgi:hypothetical protein